MAKQILGKVAYVSKGDYNNELFYEINDVVTYNGSSYVALGNTLGNIPTNTSYWQLLAQKGDTYTVSEEDLNTIKQEIVDDANNDFNQNVNSKTEEFDTHVETKTSEFDTHVQEKTNEFDTNAAEYDERITQNTEDIAYNFARTNKNFQDLLEYKEAWGNDITFEDSIEFPLGKLDMDGKSEQVTTTGINLIGVEDFEENTKDGLTVSAKNGIITLNGKFTSGGYPSICNLLFNIPKKEDNYIFKVNVLSGNKNGILGIRGMSSTNKQLWVIQVLDSNVSIQKQLALEDISNTSTIQLYTSTNPTFDNLKFTIQLTKGTKDLQYEPYTGGQPSPSPDFPQEINSIEGDLEYVGYNSKNILPITISSKTINGIEVKVNDDNSITLNGTATSSGNLVISELNNFILKGTYNFYLIGKTGRINLQGRENNSAVAYLVYSANYSNVIKKYEKATQLTEIFSYIYTNTTFNNETFKYMITKGEEVIDYVPYVEPRTLTIPTNGQVFRKVGDVADKLIIDMKTGDYYKEENIGEKIFNGSENWTLQSINEYGIANFGCQHNLNAKYGIINCNYFIHVNTEIANTKRSCTLWQTYYCYMRIEKEKASTVEEFKQWLSTHNTVVDYQLNNPTLEKLGTLTKEQLDMLVTFKSYNNVMINTNLGQADIDIKYVLDMKNYYNNIIYNNTLNGNNIVFNNGLNFPLGKLDMDGKSEQVTTTGKNLCNGISEGYYLNELANNCGKHYTNTGLVISTSNLDNFTISSKVIQERYRVACINTLPTGTSDSVGAYNGVNKDGTQDSITINTTGYPYLVVNATDLSNIQIEEGSSATEYEPYTGKQPSPSPDFPQEINSIEGDLEYVGYSSKNVLNQDLLIPFGITKGNIDGIELYLKSNTSYTISTNIASSNTGDFTPPDVGIKPNKNAFIFVSVDHDEKSVTSSKNGVNTINYRTRTFTTGKDGYLYIGKRSNTTPTMEELIKQGGYVQIEKGSFATEYEPYKAHTLTIPTNGQVFRKVGDVADKLIVDMKTGDYYKEGNIGEIVLNGSESWNIDPEQSSSKYRSFYKDFGFIKNSPVIANYLISSDASDIYYNDVQGIGTNWAGTTRIKIFDESLNSVSALKSYLQQKNLIVDGKLVTPTLEKIGRLSSTDLNKLKTFKGYNNISINTNMGQADIEVEYALDIKKYIDEKVAEISEQLI